MNQHSPSPSVGSPFKPRRVSVVVNPAAGRPLPLLAILNSAFKNRGVDWEVFITKESGDARRLAQESVKAGMDVVAACGGDGTVMEVADGLVGSGVPMSILPAGTANVMALELGIPLDLNLATELIASGNNIMREVDMATVNDRRFLLRVGIGAEAQITVGTDRESKNRLGTLAYALTAVSALNNPQISWFTMELDGLHIEVEGITCMVANSGNVGIPGIKIAPEIHVDDGLMDVVVVRRGDLPSLLAVVTAVVFDAPQQPEPLLHWQVQEAKIRAQPPMPIIVDGEALDSNSITARILPKAIRILCPPPVL